MNLTSPRPLFDSDLFGWAQQVQTPLEIIRETHLIQEGTPGEHLLILVAGSGRVETRNAERQTVVLAELKPGQIVGEMSLLEDRPTVASVIAHPGSRWLVIPFTELNDATSISPPLAASLYEQLSFKLMRQLQDQTLLVHRWPHSSVEPLRKVLVVFASLNDLDVQWLAANGERRSFAPGEQLITEGDPVDQLHILLDGDAEVFNSQENAEDLIGSSRPGEILGEMNLLTENHHAAASIRARTTMLTLCLPISSLQQRLRMDVSFKSRWFKALATLLSHRNRDQLNVHGMAGGANQHEELSLSSLDQLSQAGRRFDWLCHQVAVL